MPIVPLRIRQKLQEERKATAEVPAEIIARGNEAIEVYLYSRQELIVVGEVTETWETEITRVDVHAEGPQGDPS